MLNRLKRLFSRNTPSAAQNIAPSPLPAEDGPAVTPDAPLPLDAELAIANGRMTEDVARAEVARVLKEHRRSLREAADNPASLWAASLVDPFSWANDTPDFYPGFGGGLGGWGVPWMLNSQLRGDCLPVYINEYGLKLIRDWSRRILQFNEFAINAVENRVSYIVGKGFQYSILPKRKAETSGQSVGGESGAEPGALARKAQAVLDEFIARERWNEREQECVRRCDRDGEAIVRFFHVGGGRTSVRFVEPELLTDTVGSIHRMYGVVTDPEDIEDVTHYSIVQNPNDGWHPEDVEADQILHIKANTDFDCKRGLPTLFAVRKNLERADKLLRNMSVMAQVQATFAVLRKHKQFAPSSVSAYQQAQADVSAPNPVTGRATNMQQLFPGSVIDTSDKTQYEFPAAGVNAGGLVQVLQAELRAVCARLVMPEFMLTVDASNANYASTMVAEAPSVKNFERLQVWFARRFGDGEYGRLDVGGGRMVGAMWRVLRIAVEGGLLPGETLADLEIQVEAPTLVVRNKSEETNRARTLSQAGLLSDATWSKWEGLDYEQERRQGAKPKEAGGGDSGGGNTYTDKNGVLRHKGNGSAVRDPAPPGSAGGDGGIDFGESLNEEIKVVFGRCIDTSKPPGQKVVPCPSAPSKGGTDNKRQSQSQKSKPVAKGAAAPNHHPGAAHGSAVKVTQTKEMAAPRNAKGGIDPLPTKTTLTKQETGRVVEAGIRAYLRDIVGISDVVGLNSGKPNESIDLYGDSMAPEVKGGLCSNGKGAQQWRITFSMELGQKEQEEYDAMSEEQQKAWREQRQRACLERKVVLLKKLSEERGKEIKAVTFTGILNPDTQTIDIYRTEGYHQRISWNDPQAKYVASVKYDHV